MESWSMTPNEPMIPGRLSKRDSNGLNYQLRAVVTHYGRHENGHYICYRQHPAYTSQHDTEQDGQNQKLKWWRLSDDDVSPVSADAVLRQNGAFMLFYERVDDDLKDYAVLMPSTLTAEETGNTEPPINGVSEPSIPRDDDHESAEVEMEDGNAHAHVLNTTGPSEEQESVPVEADKPKEPEIEAANPTNVYTASTNTPKQASPSVMRTSKSRARRRKGNMMAGPPPVTAK